MPIDKKFRLGRNFNLQKSVKLQNAGWIKDAYGWAWGRAGFGESIVPLKMPNWFETNFKLMNLTEYSSSQVTVVKTRIDL